MEDVLVMDIDRWTQHLAQVIHHDQMTTHLAGGIWDVVEEMRQAAGLPAIE